MTITLEQIEAMRPPEGNVLSIIGADSMVELCRLAKIGLTALSIADTVASEARAAINMPGGENDEAALKLIAETAEGIAAQFRAEGVR